MSGARFNPPPSWPVPQGWTPPPDWQPDSSWAPAPPGWQFWVTDPPYTAGTEQPWQPQAENPGSGRRRIGLIAGAAVLAVALTAGMVAAVSWLTEDPETVARPKGMLPGTYPSEPEIAWSLTAEDLVAGSEPIIASPEYGAAFYASVGAMVTGRHIVVHALPDRSATEDAQMTAIDLTSGEVVWTRPSNASDGCAMDLVGDLLPCRNYENYGPTSQVDFVDINTGEVRSSAAVPFHLNMLASDGSALYTAGYSTSEGLIVAKGSAEDPTGDWMVSIDGDACDAYGGGDAYDLGVRDGIVYGMQGGGAEIALRASDGSSIFDHAVTDVRVLEGPTLTARRCMPGQDIDRWPTQVADAGGTVLFSSDHLLATPVLRVRAGAPDVLVTMDGVGLDARTGETLWHQSGWPSDWATTAEVGGTLVYQGGEDEVVTGASLGSGTEMWDASPAVLGHQALTDGRNLLTASRSEIQARSLADGDPLWSMGISRTTDSDVLTLMDTDEGLLFLTGTQLGLLRPTGPAAPVPAGSADQADEDAGGGTDLVTRCGTPPVFEAQDIVTENGELVVTMKITAKCPGGDVLSAPRTRIAVTTSDGQNVAAGVFDLSADPVVIRDGGGSGISSAGPSVTHKFRFPAGTFWRLPVSIDEAPDANSPQRGRVDIDGRTLLVECEPEGSGPDSAQPGSSPEASTATAPAAPARGDNESASFDALRALANADRPFVSSRLADRWVPQLSSKRPGLVADGIVWNNAETLREHLDLRLRYPEVRLLWTGDWSTFSAADFWVTIAGVTFPDSGSALRWCTDHGIDRDHCYAKLVSTTHPIDGSTAFNR